MSVLDDALREAGGEGKSGKSPAAIRLEARRLAQKAEHDYLARLDAEAFAALPAEVKAAVLSLKPKKGASLSEFRALFGEDPKVGDIADSRRVFDVFQAEKSVGDIQKLTGKWKKAGIVVSFEPTAREFKIEQL